MKQTLIKKQSTQNTYNLKPKETSDIILAAIQEAAYYRKAYYELMKKYTGSLPLEEDENAKTIINIFC